MNDDDKVIDLSAERDKRIHDVHEKRLQEVRKAFEQVLPLGKPRKKPKGSRRSAEASAAAFAGGAFLLGNVGDREGFSRLSAASDRILPPAKLDLGQCHAPGRKSPSGRLIQVNIAPPRLANLSPSSNTQPATGGHSTCSSTKWFSQGFLQ